MDKLIQDALILWATVDPIGTMAIFAGLTAGLSAAERRRTATRTILYAGGVLVGSIVVGQIILTAMGVRLISFQLGGGIILFLFGLQMIFGMPYRQMHGEAEHDIAVFPLAIPGTATPGAILAVILLTNNHIHSIPVQIGTTLVTLAVLAITWIMLLFSERIINVIGTGGASILTKIMGMILAAFSVELVMNAVGVQQWLGQTP
ncbi:MAG: chemotaxis protein CheR [Salinisphaeraceae bacterium]|nr:chemotaxis protein CheR [Salinisphaeraceae bacterium]